MRRVGEGNINLATQPPPKYRVVVIKNARNIRFCCPLGNVLFALYIFIYLYMYIYICIDKIYVYKLKLTCSVTESVLKNTQREGGLIPLPWMETDCEKISHASIFWRCSASFESEHELTMYATKQLSAAITDSGRRAVLPSLSLRDILDLMASVYTIR